MICFYIKEPEGIERLKFRSDRAIFDQDGITIEMSMNRFKSKYGFFCNNDCNSCSLEKRRLPNV